MADKNRTTLQEMFPAALDAIMEADDNVAFIKDTKLRYVCCSRGMIHLSGAAGSKDIIGKTDHDLMFKKLADKYEATDKKILESGEALTNYIERLPERDGLVRYVKTSKYPICDHTGKIIGIYGFGGDFTEEHEAYAQLKLLADNAPCGLASYEVTNDGVKLLYFTNGLSSMKGYEEEAYRELTRNDPTALVFDEDKSMLKEKFDTVHRKGAVMDCIFRTHTKDGGYRWINIRGILTEKSEDSAIINTVQFDITKQKEIEEKIRIHEKEYALAIFHSGRFIYRYSHADRSISMPQETAERFGWPARLDNMPEPVLEAGVIAPESIETFKNFYKAIQRGDKTGDMTVRRKIEDGSFRWFHVQFSNVFGDDQMPASAMIVFEDITDKRNDEIGNSLTRRRLIEALRTVYPAIVSINLTKGTYTTLVRGEHKIIGDKSKGRLDDIIYDGAEQMPDGFAKKFTAKFTAEALKKELAAENDTIRTEYQQMFPDGKLRWVEIIAMRVRNEYDDGIIGVMMGRIIDEQKAIEEKLKKALELSSAELAQKRMYQDALDASMPVGTVIFSKDDRKMLYMGGSLMTSLGYSYEEMRKIHAAGLKGLILEEDYKMIFQDICLTVSRPGEVFEQEYRVRKKDGTIAWLHEKGIMVNMEGRPVYIIVYMDTTESKEMEEKLRISEEEMKLAMAQIGKMILQFDVRNHILTMPEAYASRYDIPVVLEDVPNSTAKDVFTDEASHTKYMDFYNAIITGQEKVSVEYNIYWADGTKHWEQAEAVTILTLDGKPAKTIITIEDVTLRRKTEAENEKLRQKERRLRTVAVHSKRQVYRYDIASKTARADVSEGNPLGVPLEDGNMPESVIESGRVLPDSAEDFREIFRKIHEGIPDGSARIHITGMDGEIYWMDMNYSITEFASGRPVAAAISYADITEAMNIQQQAEIDGMTGLYNKQTSERLIKQRLLHNRGTRCALCIADLDNLKKINDTLGHKQGDKAIKALAGVMRAQFRKSDIIGRIGGDEFIVFLDGSGGEAKIRSLMAACMRKMAAVNMDDDLNKGLHGSIGVVLGEVGTDTYDDLFKKADKALYHVKRNGKDNYAIYKPEMEDDTYTYEVNDEKTFWEANSFDSEELNHLLDAVATIYPLVISVNLTQNTYYMMQYDDFMTKSCITTGVFDDLIEEGSGTFHPDDSGAFKETFARENLLAAHAEGKKIVSHEGMQLGDDGVYRNIRTDVIFVKNEANDDVLEISLAREIETSGLH